MNVSLIMTTIGSLIFGGFVGFINSRISKKAILRTEFSKAVGINAVRFLIDILALVVVFVFCRITNVSLLVPLLACAVGLTVGGMFFLVRLSKSVNEQPRESLQQFHDTSQDLLLQKSVIADSKQEDEG